MIVLSNVEKRLGTFRLSVHRLAIERGEYLVILGPSGAGKTVLLLTMAGLLHPDAGDIFFNGSNVTNLPPHKRNIGLVFQEASLFPHLNVIQNIAFGRPYRRKKAEQVARATELLIDMLLIRPLLSRTVENLSGGEKQRVAVARALANGPAILLLDEPLGLLDQKTREELRAELRKLHDELGTMTLHVTHDRNEAFAIADRIAILNEGRLVQVATRDEILARPASEFVARFIGVENVFSASAEQDVSGKTFLKVGQSYLNLSCKERGDVRFCIRPEAISLHREHPFGVAVEKLIPGVVKSVEDRGPVIRVTVNCVLGDVVVSCGRSEFMRSGASCSSPVWLHPDPAAIHIFPQAGNESAGEVQ